MKRFLVTLIVIILAVSVGFGVFYLVRDNEVISLKTASLYKDVEEGFEISLDMENPNSYTTVEVISSDESVVKVEDSVVDRKNGLATGTFKALKGGNARITFKTNNAKFRNITCDVVVCDGSDAYPFRIDTAEELQSIGYSETYTSDKSYALNENIDLGTLDATFKPLPSFTGVFDGNGYTINNLTIKDSSIGRIGLFQEVGMAGVVKNVKFDGALIETNASTTFAGVVAGENKGIIKLVEVISANLKNTNVDAVVGTIAGSNTSTNTKVERQIARIDRTSANVIINSEDANAKGVVGGIVGQNLGGVVINSYAKGNAYVKEVTAFGGIIGENRYLAISGSGTGYSGDLGANVKDCYSIVNITSTTAGEIGQIIGINAGDNNKIVGNHYIIDDVNSIKGVGSLSDDFIYGVNITQKGTKGITSQELKEGITSLESYKYYEKEIKYNPSEGTAQLVEKEGVEPLTYTWQLSVWKIDSTINNGYPVLNFLDEYVDDNFDNTAVGDLITTIQGLNKIRDDLSGTYFINANIDLTEAGEWTPIGTKNQPFEGQVYVLDNYKLYNLTIASTVIDDGYAGFFGVLGSSAYIQDMTIENVNLTANNSYVGAIAGLNNGTINNAQVINGSINALVSAGGVVGENKGTIIDATVNSDSSLTIKALNNSKQTNVGGVAGFNSESIISSKKTNSVTGNVKITSDSNACLGGIVGHNTGKIENVKVELTRDPEGYGVITSSTGLAGGVAGYSTGVVNKAYVSATIGASTSSESNVAGVVGKLMAKKAMAITQAVVENSYITGYYSAGVVAVVNTEYALNLSVTQPKGDFNGNVKISNTIDYINDVTIREVAVEDTVTIKGSTTGGFIAYMTKGMLADGYTKANLTGTNNAGIVYSIGFNSSSKEGGVIFDVYSACTSANGGYAVSSSQIHKSWKLLGWFTDESDRSVGIIFDYHYVSRDNLSNPDTSAPLGIGYSNQGRNESTLKDASTWGFLSTSVWSVDAGSYPKLKNCEIVKEM